MGKEIQLKINNMGRKVYICFSVPGGVGVNNKGLTWLDETEHPVPKLKMTGQQSWTPKAKRYVRWKALVVDSLLKAYMLEQDNKVFTRRVALGGKPIPKSQVKSHMEIYARYKNFKHPDTENVFGSIADALFENDTALSGSFDFVIDKEFNPETFVQLIIEVEDEKDNLVAVVEKLQELNEMNKKRRRKLPEGVVIAGDGKTLIQL